MKRIIIDKEAVRPLSFIIFAVCLVALAAIFHKSIADSAGEYLLAWIALVGIILYNLLIKH